jgi:hypothetical protein
MLRSRIRSQVSAANQRHRGWQVRLRKPEFGSDRRQAPIRVMRRQSPSRLRRERHHGVAVDTGYQ